MNSLDLLTIFVFVFFTLSMLLAFGVALGIINVKLIDARSDKLLPPTNRQIIAEEWLSATVGILAVLLMFSGLGVLAVAAYMALEFLASLT